VHDDDLAEDLTQEVFCKIFRGARAYRPMGAFAPWLKQVAANLARDAIRRKQRTPETPLEEVAPGWEPAGPDWAVALESEWLRADLKAAIGELPDEQRLTLVMHFFGGMTLADIAWALQCPEGTIKSRLWYGLRRVRAALMQQWAREKDEMTP
jgi:RNA polymerase sigma-70 factor (ECF subfamily)